VVGVTQNTDAVTKKQAKLTKPAPLRGGHKLSDFDCGEEVLNIWLRKRALPAIAARTANTFVVCRGRRVVGYFALANGAVAHKETSAKVRRNVPDPIPATILARLAVDKTEQRRGLGQELLQEAMKRALAGAKHSAARILVVHAINSKTVRFYMSNGFRLLGGGATTPAEGEIIALYMPLDTIVAAL
jgi:GNAT superfamily N-acetyltransferase